MRFDRFAIVRVAFQTLHALALPVDHVSIRRGDNDGTAAAAGRWGRRRSVHVAGFRQLNVLQRIKRVGLGASEWPSFLHLSSSFVRLQPLATPLLAFGCTTDCAWSSPCFRRAFRGSLVGSTTHRAELVLVQLVVLVLNGICTDAHDVSSIVPSNLSEDTKDQQQLI